MTNETLLTQLTKRDVQAVFLSEVGGGPAGTFSLDLSSDFRPYTTWDGHEVSMSVKTAVATVADLRKQINLYMLAD